MKEILPVAEIMQRLVAETEAACRGRWTSAETAAHGALYRNADALISLALDRFRPRFLGRTLRASATRALWRN